MLLFGCVVATLGVAVFASPVVSSYELQRRDRGLSTEDRFVTRAYWVLLNRPPDPTGLTIYSRLYDESGAEAVVTALVSSPEFRSRHRAADSSGGNHDPARITQQYLEVLDRGDQAPLQRETLIGRIGFVAIILAGALLVLQFQWRAEDSKEPSDEHVFLPARFVVGLFACLALTWWLHTQFLLTSFEPQAFGFLEWASQMANLAIARGQANIWTPYPQGTQTLLIALVGLSNGLAAPLASDVWTPFTIFRVLYHLAVLVVPSIVVVLLVYRLGAMFSPATATFAAAAAGFSFAPLYFSGSGGPIVVVDPLPALLSLAGVYLLARKQFVGAGATIALGVALKLFPIVLLPVGLVAARNRADRLKLLIAAGAVLLLAFGPLALANWDVFLSPIRWQSSRPAWESWYAFVNWAANAPHEYLSPYFQDISVGDSYSWVFWGITPPLTSLLTPVPASPVRWENVVSLAGTVATFSLLLAARIRSPRAMLRWALYCLTAIFFWNIGWSPQYELYLIPLLLLAFDRPSLGVVAALFLSLVTVLEYPILLQWAYFYGGAPVWLTWGVLMTRYLFFAWLLGWIAVRESSWQVVVDRIAGMVERRRRIGETQPTESG